MYHIVLSFLTSFILTYVAIPSIIKIAKEKRLMDEPGGRRVHQNSIPTLGGIAIFAGVIFPLFSGPLFRFLETFSTSFVLSLSFS
ncbi:MAG: hypothetical protein IPJ64_06850 [Saprospiraceae bacterium]|nr:hypothetical protein [Saprospiraceae bacterium]